MIILKTCFFLLQYQSGTNLASALETQQASILFNTFKIKLLNFIQPCANSILNIHNHLGIKLLTRLRLGLSLLREHNFRLLWILYANVAKILNQQRISFSTALNCSFLAKPSFRKLGTLMIIFYLKAKRN